VLPGIAMAYGEEKEIIGRSPKKRKTAPHLGEKGGERASKFWEKMLLVPQKDGGEE